MHNFLVFSLVYQMMGYIIRMYNNGEGKAKE